MFQSRRITFDMFDQNPMLLNDPSLVVKIGGEWATHLWLRYSFLISLNRYYPWSIAGPVVTSVAVFQKPLTTDGMKKLLPPSGSVADSRAYFSIRNWWARGKSPEPHHVLFSNSFSYDRIVPHKITAEIWTGVSFKDKISWPGKEEGHGRGEESQEPAQVRQITPSYFRAISEDSLYIQAFSYLKHSPLQKSLKLKYGSNTVKFEVASGIQGKAICRAKIFLWKHDAKVVISDVDGTITKYVHGFCWYGSTQSY